MNRILARWAGTALLALALGFTAAAQQQGQQGQQPPAQPAKAGENVPPAAPVISPEEEKEYKAFLAVTEVRPIDPKKIIAMGNDFVGKYPQSTYAAFIYSTMANAYQTTGDPDKMFEAGQKAIELNENNI
ncbi:MAG TPA: tetratricopeptide repeat protein, partial [Candidatus Acidoferrales bacterium]